MPKKKTDQGHLARPLRYGLRDRNGNPAFDLNCELREAYKVVSPQRQVVVDISRSDYLDSAGLLMRIQLRESVGGDRASPGTLHGAKETVRTMLDVANLGRLFRIT